MAMTACNRLGVWEANYMMEINIQGIYQWVLEGGIKSKGEEGETDLKSQQCLMLWRAFRALVAFWVVSSWSNRVYTTVTLEMCTAWNKLCTEKGEYIMHNPFPFLKSIFLGHLVTIEGDQWVFTKFSFGTITDSYFRYV